MFRLLENILGYRLVATDGEIGKVHDFFVDDSVWRVRYLAVETGTWLSRRRVLIAPASFGAINAATREFQVNLTRSQVRSSPDIDTDKPVSRQQEILMNAHYGWPSYWNVEALVIPDPEALLRQRPPMVQGDAHLRSFREITSYSLRMGDRAVGNAQDLVADDTDWSLKLLVAVLDSWRALRQVALPIEAVAEVSWPSRTMRLVDTDIASLPLFNPNSPVNREVTVSYFDYYGRQVAGSPS